MLSQNKIFGEVNYEGYYNTYMKGNTKYVMYFDNQNSYCEREKDSIIGAQSGLSDELSNIFNEVRTTKKTIPKYYFRNNSRNKLIYFEQSILKKYNVTDTTAIFNWELVAETKKVGNYICQKAISKFRGRNYIAWYSAEIAVPFGPQKIYGLPGLVLEVYEENYKYYQVATNIKLNHSDNTILKKKISYLEKLDKITLQQFHKQKIVDAKKFEALVNSKIGRDSEISDFTVDEFDFSNPQNLEIFETNPEKIND